METLPSALLMEVQVQLESMCAVVWEWLAGYSPWGLNSQTQLIDKTTPQEGYAPKLLGNEPVISFLEFVKTFLS